MAVPERGFNATARVMREQGLGIRCLRSRKELGRMRVLNRGAMPQDEYIVGEHAGYRQVVRNENAGKAASFLCPPETAEANPRTCNTRRPAPASILTR